MKLDGREVFRYARSLLPVPRIGYSADELFSIGCKSYDKLLAMEILNIHIRAFDTRVDVSEEIDIACSSELAERFIGQLLPRALSSGAVNDVIDFKSLMKGCFWLEDEEVNSLPVVREIEPNMQDLPDVCWQFNKTLNEDILETHGNFVKELECVTLKSSTEKQVQYATKPGPSGISTVRDGGRKIGDSEQQTLLDDASFNLKFDTSSHHDKPWEIHPSQAQCPRQCLPHSKRTDHQNLAGLDSESEIDGLPDLLDFDPAEFLLEKLQFRPNVMQHEIQAESSSSCAVGCLSWLDEAVDSENAPKPSAMSTVNTLFELPEVLDDEYIGSLFDLKLGAYISTSLTKPNPVELEELDPPDVALRLFEKLFVLPELALQAAGFHFLQVPSFIGEHQARVHEDVFKDLFREKTLPIPSTATDLLYLDWHLSQVGHCNNYGCFHLQKRLLESELSVIIQREMISGKRVTDRQLLLGLTEDIYPWHQAEPENANDTMNYPAAKTHASVSTSMLNFSNFTYAAEKAEDKNCSDQSVLTDEPRILTKDQVPLAGPSPTTMDNVLSLMKQARQGVLSGDAKSMQGASEIEFHQEGCPGISNPPNQSCGLSPEDFQALESVSTAEKISIPKSPFLAGVGAAASNLFQTSNQVETELVEPLDMTACPPQEILQMGLNLAPPLQPTLNESNLHQSELEDMTQFSRGLGPHLVVVAKILQPDGSVFLQRRSSYQKILGLENEDLQVVERELMLPVDLILNPSTCLTIYTEEKLLGCTKINSYNSEGFFSCVMDTVVDSHMKALSFSFERWFMIFEGGLEFNSAVTNILKNLYICSAGFEMRIQGFVSADSMTTDSLVLGCIKKMWRMSKRPFDSPMSEDLTEGEICLATFPCLNPLSSHAILCLHVPIATFISWSSEEQKSALQGFDIRSESLNLLRAQALYGKLEPLAHSQVFNQHSWPSASEIVAPEVANHVRDPFPYFPPASEIGNCEFEETTSQEPADEPPEDEHIDPCPISCPDPSFQNHLAGQGTFKWDGDQKEICWHSDDDILPILPHYTHGLKLQSDTVEENYDYSNPVEVQSILQQFIRNRKDAVKDLKHFVTEPDLFCDSFEVLNNESYNAGSCKNKSSPLADYAVDTFDWGVHLPSRSGVTDDLQWAPLQKTPSKRNISALEQFRHQKSVAPALRSKKKKLRPAVPSTRSKDDRPPTQLEHSLKISRNSCYKSNPPMGRSV